MMHIVIEEECVMDGIKKANGGGGQETKVWENVVDLDPLKQIY